MLSRTLFAFAAVLSMLAAHTHAQPKPAAEVPDFKVTLLGTGSPAPIMKRFGPGTLVQVGGQNLVFDAGRGVTQRLMQSGLKLGQVTPCS